MDYEDLGRDRTERDATTGAIPCVVTGINLTGEPMVTVRPTMTTPYDTFDGVQVFAQPLEILEVPYVFPSSDEFAFFIPPKLGMQGFLVPTQTEIGEASEGVVRTARRRDARSSYFIPGGSLTGSTFAGDAQWAELRSEFCRVAVSADKVHVQAGQTSLVLTQGAFDVVVNGRSLIGALKELSAHIKTLEALVHPNGMTHGTPHTHQIDDFAAATPPTRAQQGVR